MGSITFRVRSIVWFVAGAVSAAAVTLMFVNAWRVDAAPGDDDATFVATTPCRLADTRPAPNRVGPASTLGDASTTTFAVHGSNGECSIPAEAVAVSLNVTALGASALSFLTFWPDGERPLAASLNPAPGQPPVPNAVTVDLSGAGSFDVYNDTGNVDVVIDVNGYYTQSSLKELASRVATLETTGGPAGEDGADGPPGPPGPVNRISDEQIAVLAWYDDPGAAATIDVGLSPSAVAFDGTNLYVTNSSDDTVSVIDPTTNTTTGPPIPVGDNPDGVAFDGTNLYVTNVSDDTVSVIDPTTYTTIGPPIPVGHIPGGVAFDGTNLYVTNQGDGTVTKLIPR